MQAENRVGRRESLIVVGSSAALSGGALDALLALLADPKGYPTLVSAFPAYSMLVVILAVAFGGLFLLAALGLPRLQRDQPVRFAVSLGSFILASFVLVWIADLNAVSSILDNIASAAAHLGVIASISLLASVGCWLTLAKWAASKNRALLASVAAIALLLTSAALSLTVIQTAVDGSSLLGRSVAVAAIWFAGVAAVCFVRHGSSRSIQSIQSIQVACVSLLTLAVLSPLASLYVWHLDAALPKSRLAADAPIKRVILLTVDTLRKDSLNIYNPNGVGTPRLDELAADSLVFSNAFSVAPWTVPSFASILTGLWPDQHGVNENFAALPDQLKTLAQYMREAGYLTAAIGAQPQLLRMGRGFDDFDFEPKRPPLHTDTTGGRALYRFQRIKRTTPLLTQVAIDWLEAHQQEDFFLWVHWVESHISYEPPKQYLPESPLLEERGTSFDGELHAAVHVGREIRTAADREWLRILYDAEVRYTDDMIGRVLDQLVDLGLYEGSLIIFTADHGEEFWDHGGWEHGHSLYDELVAVPLLLKLPGATRNGRVTASVSNASLLTTILELCAISTEVDAQAAPSLTRHWTRAAGDAPPEPIFLGALEYLEPRRAVVFDGFKYIAEIEGSGEELYDLRTDPMERSSLISTRPETRKRARAILKKRESLLSTGAPAPTPKNADEPLRPEVESQLRALGYIE